MKKNNIKLIIILLLSLVLLTSCLKRKEISSKEIEKNHNEIKEVDEATEDINEITEIWEVDNEWRLKIDKIYSTEERNHYANKKEGQKQYTSHTPVDVIKIQYTYEKLNTETEFEKLSIMPYKVVTDNDENAYNYPLYEINHPYEIQKNQICNNVEVAFGFNKRAETIKIYFKQNDSNDNIQEIIYEYKLNNKDIKSL